MKLQRDDVLPALMHNVCSSTSSSTVTTLDADGLSAFEMNAFAIVA